jgi:D-alanine-D-alanine ligase
VAVVSTRASPCRCAEAWLGALGALGLEGLPVAVEEMSACRDALAEAALVVEYTDTYRGRGELRPLVRHQLASWGARLVGAPAAAAQLSDDKIAARARLERAGIAVAAGRVVTPEAALGDDGGGFPAVLKRPFEHGSRGVRRVRDGASLKALAARWFRKGEASLLAEEFVEGREVALSVIEFEDGPRCLPPVEILLPKGAIYTRKRKWSHGGAPLSAAGFSGAEADLLRRTALTAFRALELADLARFDVRLTARGPVFLEANARPSVEPGLALPFAAWVAGLPWVEAARLVLLSAARRHGLKDLVRRLRTEESRAEI